jgi:hypothetical protein
MRQICSPELIIAKNSSAAQIGSVRVLPDLLHH